MVTVSLGSAQLLNSQSYLSALCIPPGETLRDRFSTYLICNIIHNYDAMSASIVTGSDSSKPLLSCCVPLQGK